MQKRRKDNRIILLYKGLKGRAKIPTDDLIPKNRRCRNQHSSAFQIPSASTNAYVTNRQAKPQQTPSVEKHAHPPKVVYCAFLPSEAIQSHYFPLQEDSSRVLALELNG